MASGSAAEHAQHVEGGHAVKQDETLVAVCLTQVKGSALAPEVDGVAVKPYGVMN